MIMQVSCPTCKGALTAPAELAGKPVRCPRCSGQMLLPEMPSSGNGKSGEPPAPPVAPAPRHQNADLLPPATGAERQGKDAANSSVRTARFIANREPSAESLVPHGALPTLQLAESESRPARLIATEAWRGPVIGVLLVVSVMASAGLLLWEPTAQSTVAPDKHYAWRELEEHYFGDGAALRPYQRLLRQAQQAHHRRDRPSEVALLRQVLDLLHAERANASFGVTGYQTPAPPNDRDLEEKITLLLRAE